MSIYSFIKKTLDLGVGTRDLGFLRSQSIPRSSLTGGGTLVRGQLITQSPAYVKMSQQVVPVSLLGTNGISIQAQATLQQLANMQKG